MKLHFAAMTDTTSQPDPEQMLVSTEDLQTLLERVYILAYRVGQFAGDEPYEPEDETAWQAYAYGMRDALKFVALGETPLGPVGE